ncbi:MAG: hypothetical protein ACI92G_001526 [Candidatus Pelagisphaera sp.]|jgi:hypothetical protein
MKKTFYKLFKRLKLGSVVTQVQENRNTVRKSRSLKEIARSRIIALSGKPDVKGIRSDLSELDSNKRNLLQASKLIEDKFITTIGALEGIGQMGTSLKNQCDKLQDLSKEDESNSVMQSVALFEPGVEFAETSIARIRNLIDDLDIFEKRIFAIFHVEENLDRIFGQLTYLRTLIRVSSSSLDQEVQVMILALVEEIMQLQSTVANVFKEKFEELRSARKTVLNVRSGFEKWLEFQNKNVDQRKSEIDLVLKATEENFHKALELGKVRDGIGNDIRSNTCRAVIAMQSHDIVSQKLSHIYEIADEMETRFGAINNKSNRAESCLELRFIEISSSILKSQIKTIQSELKNTSSTIRSSLNDILNAVTHLDTFGENPSQSDDGYDVCNLVENILDSLGGLKGMLSSTEMIASQSYQEILPIRNLASSFTKVVLSLSSQLHLIGLNSEIQAARVGVATGLEVLSSNISEVSKSTGEMCGNVSLELDTLIEGLTEIVDEFDDLQKQGTNEMQELESQSGDCHIKLEGYSSEFQETSGQIDKGMDALKEFILPIIEDADFEGLIIMELQTLEENLDRLSRNAKSQADALRTNVDVDSLLTNMTQRYTMESELATHMAAMGGTGLIESPAIAEESPGNDDVLFFDDFSLEESAASDRDTVDPTKKSTTSEDAVDEIELWMD